MATWIERTGSRKITSSQATRRYYGTDVLDEQEVADYVLSLPVTIAGMPFSDFEASESDEAEGDYELSVTWGQPDSGGGDTSTPAVGESGYRFNYQAPSAHIMQSLATINAYEYFWDLPNGPPDFNGAINVVDDEGKLRVEGFNLQPPPEVFTIPYTDVDDVITSAYQTTVRGLCGKVNNATFYGAAAGEIMLVRAQGERRGGLWNLEFGFAYVPNVTGFVVGDITDIDKDGLDLMWVYYGAAKDAAAKELVRRPIAVYIERVFERADLNDLNLPF